MRILRILSPCLELPWNLLQISSCVSHETGQDPASTGDSFYSASSSSEERPGVLSVVVWWLMVAMSENETFRLHSITFLHDITWIHGRMFLICWMQWINRYIYIYNRYESNTSPRVPVPWDLQEFDNQIHPWNSEEVLEEVPHTFTEGEMQFGETFTDCFVKKFLDILLTSVDYWWLLVNLIILIIVGRGFLCVFAGDFFGEIKAGLAAIANCGRSA